MEENTYGKGYEILKRLKEMAENPKGILPICVEDGCGKIKLGDHWVGKEDLLPRFSQTYDEVVRLYTQKEKEYPGEGVSGSYCPEGLQNYLDSIKK